MIIPAAKMRLLRLLIILLVTSATATLCTGCAGGALWETVFGPNKIPAKYVPPKASTLVLVENFRNPAISQVDADQVASELCRQLTDQKVVPLVDPDKLVAVRDVDPAKYHAMSILELGRAVGAKQVMYVVLQESSVEADPTMSAIHGRVSALVRMVDVDTGLTLWPLESAQGYPLSADIPYNRADPDRATAMHAEMLSQLSDAIAKLFYDWQPDRDQAPGDG
jgi:hypothetical protein